MKMKKVYRFTRVTGDKRAGDGSTSKSLQRKHSERQIISTQGQKGRNFMSGDSSSVEYIKHKENN